MAWKKNSAEMVKVLDDALRPVAAHRRMMFGTPACCVNDNMFAGLHQDNLNCTIGLRLIDAGE